MIGKLEWKKLFSWVGLFLSVGVDLFVCLFCFSFCTSLVGADEKTLGW